jgi:hypothetical protein
LQHIAAKDALLWHVRVNNGLPCCGFADGILRHHRDIDKPGVITLNKHDVRVEAAEFVAGKIAQGIDVFDLLQRNDIEIHLFNALNN